MVTGRLTDAGGVKACRCVVRKNPDRNVSGMNDARFEFRLSEAQRRELFYNASLSPDNWIYKGGSPTNWKDGGVHAVPGPLAGAGLPVLIAA